MPSVQLFVTCLVNGFFPAAGEAVVKVLERAGCEVEIPSTQTCCGQPAFNCGLTDEARRLGKKILDDFGTSDVPVVVPSGSCADMLIHHLPHLFEDDETTSAAARALAGRVIEFTAFLVDRLGITDLGAHCAKKVAYHPSCHGLRNLGLGPQALALLDAVDGLSRVEIDRATECCGFGGLFAVELPEVSAAIMNLKLDRVEAAAPELLVGGDVSCLLHLEGGLRRRGSKVEVRHIAQILAEEQ
jgi:L-lactate dehydrogenase complex protein LldE